MSGAFGRRAGTTLEVDRIALDALLLRELMPDVRLRPGTVLPARVLERNGAHGLLWLAGTPVVAELPEGLPTGERLRLAVAGLEGGKVLLRVAPEPDAPGGPASGEVAAPAARPVAERAAERPGAAPAAAAAARAEGTVPVVQPPVALPLPGGLQARVAVTERDPEGGRPARGAAATEDAPRSVALHYDSPLHGRLELRLVVAPGRVAVTVGAAPGPAQAVARAHAGELREALGRALDRPAEVHVGARRDPLDLRA